MIRINISKNIQPEDNSIVLLATADTDFGNYGLSGEEITYTKTQIHARLPYIFFDKPERRIIVQPVDVSKTSTSEQEKMRKKAARLHAVITQQKIRKLTIVNTIDDAAPLYAFVEGMVLSNYQFLKYLNKKDEKQHSLSDITVVGDTINPTEISHLNFVLEGVYKARDMDNEPANIMTPVHLAAEIRAMGKETGFDVQTFDKATIEKMKMGGVLAVNRGSTEEPTFSVLEWKPATAKNKNPIVLVGKAITFDTGGHNLKTGEYIYDMKDDMAGGAAVAAAIYAVAKSELPVHVIGLVPSTDNRLSANACSPGDIIIMYDGTTVEVVNTDAEGRIILADALAYAKKYKPELVVDMATLTGSAQRALGKHGIALMSNASLETVERLKKCGESVHERIVEFPLWEEYFEDLRSDIADLKNVGGDYAGAITAGKFLEYFTAYPFIHLDIAGVAFTKEADGYRGVGGTGAGVRLLFEFLKKYDN